MKNTLENIAVGLVFILSLTVVGLVVQYNMIDTGEQAFKDPDVTRSLQSETNKETKTASYLDSLEGYEDVDVKVAAPAEESTANIAVVATESTDEGLEGNIGTAVENVEKKESYVSNLADYEDVDVKVDPTKEASSVNIATVEGTVEEDDIAGSISSAIEGAGTVVEAEAHAETPVEEDAEPTPPSADPLSDLVSDLDSILGDIE